MPRSLLPNRRSSIASSQTPSPESTLPQMAAGIAQSLAPSTKTEMPFGYCPPAP